MGTQTLKSHRVSKSRGQDQTALPTYSGKLSNNVLVQLWLAPLLTVTSALAAGMPQPRGMFKLLDDEYESVATESGLYTAHDKLHSLEHELDAVVEAAASEGGEQSWEAVRQKFDAFKELNESHLKKEEEVMMKRVRMLSAVSTLVSVFSCGTSAGGIDHSW